MALLLAGQRTMDYAEEFSPGYLRGAVRQDGGYGAGGAGGRVVGSVACGTSSATATVHCAR